jgi:hypothetical protein
MTGAGRADPDALAVALYLDGCDDPDRAADGTWLADDDFLVLVNAWWEPLDFTLPDTRPQAGRRVLARRPLGEQNEFGYDYLILAAGVLAVLFSGTTSTSHSRPG